MIRRLFNIACILSLLVCMAAAGLWVRSYWRGDGIVVEHRRGSTADGDPCLLAGVGSERGLVVFMWPGDDSMSAVIDEPMNRGQKVRIGHVSESSPFFFDFWSGSYGGFSYSPTFGAWQVTIKCNVLVVPLYAIILALGVVPLLWVRRYLSGRRRASAGKCPRCGYDLRATPDRCPECGTITPVTGAKTPAKAQ